MEMAEILPHGTVFAGSEGGGGIVLNVKKGFSFSVSAAFSFIMAAMFFTDVFPSMACSISMFTKKDFLSSAEVTAWQITGTVICFFLIFLTLLISYHKKTKKLIHEAVYFIADLLEILFFCVLFLTVSGVFMECLLIKYVEYHEQIFTVELVLFGIAAVILPWLLFGMLTGQKTDQTGKGLFCRGLPLLIHPFSYALWIFMSATLVAAELGTDHILCVLLPFGDRSPAANFGRHLLIAALHAGLLYMIMITMNASAEKWKEKSREKKRRKISAERVKKAEQAAMETGKLRTGRLISAGVSVAGTAALLIAAAVVSPAPSGAETVAAEIMEQGANGAEELLAEDFDAALYYYESACSRMEAWKAYLHDDSETLRKLSGEFPKEEEVRYLEAVVSGEPAELESYIMKENSSSRMKQRLLAVYASMEEGTLSPEQENRREEIVRSMISEENFRRDTVAATDIIGQEQELEDLLKDMDILHSDAKAVEVLADSGREGKLNGEMADTLIELAESEQEDEGLQYLAGVYGASLTYDDADHYEETVRCLKRFDRLHDENELYSEEQRQRQKVITADLMMECYGYEAAAEVLKDIRTDSVKEDAEQMLLVCYERMGEYGACYDMAQKILQEDAENISAMFYVSLCALKLERPEESFEILFDLSDVIRSSDTAEETRIEAEQMLYPLIEFATILDRTDYTEFQYRYYPDLTEEQKERLEENEFLYAYMEAVYSCFSNGDEDTAMEQINKVLDLCPGLPQALYLKGVICAQEKEFEKAAEAYRQSLAVRRDSATTWYALANAYDAMEMYEEAYEACINAEALQPETDHDSDWYGVGLHNQNLKRNLELILGEEE